MRSGYGSSACFMRTSCTTLRGKLALFRRSNQEGGGDSNTQTHYCDFDYDNPTSAITATCTIDGEATFTCTHSGCSETSKQTYGKLQHQWADVVTKPATITEKGEKISTCSLCGATSGEPQEINTLFVNISVYSPEDSIGVAENDAFFIGTGAKYTAEVYIGSVVDPTKTVTWSIYEEKQFEDPIALEGTTISADGVVTVDPRDFGKSVRIHATFTQGDFSLSSAYNNGGRAALLVPYFPSDAFGSWGYYYEEVFIETLVINKDTVGFEFLRTIHDRSWTNLNHTRDTNDGPIEYFGYSFLYDQSPIREFNFYIDEDGRLVQYYYSWQNLYYSTYIREEE